MMFKFVLKRILLEYLACICLIVTLYVCSIDCEQTMGTTKICMNDTKDDQHGRGGRPGSLRARHKTCFLRPDTGPCRADIVQWYYDVRQGKCYRFFWGGCQGNGNRFANEDDCYGHCFLNKTSKGHVPFFCQLPFDYGTCFGHYDRYAWDNLYKVCKRRLYSGCGGNQNNFETLAECYANCRSIPSDTNNEGLDILTTCMPLDMPALNRKRRR